MNSGSRVEGPLESEGVTVLFGERFQASQQFDLVFKEGMALVERSAAYLDGDGRRDSKSLPSHVTVLYATESMRLTTRLLELASWLLIRRALKEGEITEEEARRKRARLKLQVIGRPAHVKNFAELPEGLRSLVESSFALYDRILQLDRAMTQAPAEEAQGSSFNPVGSHMQRIERAFAKTRYAAS